MQKMVDSRSVIIFATLVHCAVLPRSLPCLQIMHALNAVVQALPFHDMIELLLNWMAGCEVTSLIMVIHNGHKFDFPVLKSAIDQIRQKEALCNWVTVFADSLLLLQLRLPRRKSYTQESSEWCCECAVWCSDVFGGIKALDLVFDSLKWHLSQIQYFPTLVYGLIPLVVTFFNHKNLQTLEQTNAWQFHSIKNFEIPIFSQSPLSIFIILSPYPSLVMIVQYMHNISVHPYPDKGT